MEAGEQPLFYFWQYDRVRETWAVELGGAVILVIWVIFEKLPYLFGDQVPGL